MSDPARPIALSITLQPAPLRRTLSERRRSIGRHAKLAHARQLLKKMEWPLAILALMVVPALILEDRTTSPALRSLFNAVNWFVWLAFVAEFCLGFAVARSGRTFLRTAWWDLAMIVLSPPFLVPEAMQKARGLRALRLFRLMRLMRALAVATIGLRHARKLLGAHGFPYVLLVAVAAVGLGAIGIYIVEKDYTIRSAGDALWWAVVAVATSGYGDVSPVTGEGRFIALILMFVGIGVVSVFTASVASFFVGQDQAKESDAVESRLAELEGRVAELLIELRRSRAAVSADGEHRGVPEPHGCSEQPQVA